MFRPPVNRTMRTLDRSFFRRTFPLSAARIHAMQTISKIRVELGRSKDVLCLERLASVRPDPDTNMAIQGRKCLLLKPEIRHDDSSTWSPKLNELVQSEDISIIPYILELDYDYWTYYDIISSILPEEEEELPTGFNTAGHVAHFNLKDRHLPYKSLIAEVLLDKNPLLRTVINKIDDVGSSNEYRTFKYEVLAGDPNLELKLKEQNCVFHFDYSKTYWNSKLSTEHERMVNLFKEGDAVCDVMCGVGPFAVPAGKKKIFVFANDLNPASYISLQDNISTNKVWKYVLPFNEDGRHFIRSSAAELLNNSLVVRSPRESSRHRTPSTPPKKPITPKTLTRPRTFSHYILNLPASALSFLPSFIGLYAGHESLFVPLTSTQLPMIHVYCFSSEGDENDAAKNEICGEISRVLESEITTQTPEMVIHDVRRVAPKKRMFCASFRLPPEVAFREVE